MWSYSISLKMFSFLLFLLPLIVAAPLEVLQTASHCGQYDGVMAGQYSLSLNQWGLRDATSGYGCAALTSLSGTTIAWNHSWAWEGDYKVKSYTNIQLNKGLGKRLSAIKRMPTTWSWSQTSPGTVVSNVAYDLFTALTPGGNNHNEIMIWLANFNDGPISASYDSNGNAIPVATKIVLAPGYTWDLYSGSNGENPVYSFLPSNGLSIMNFNGDLKVFLKYLLAHGHIRKEEFLKTAQGGCEAMLGSAYFTTLAYSLVIH